MARIIRLKESDITNIVKKIIREKEERKGKKATSMKNLKKPSKKQMAEIKRKYFSGSVEESLKNYRMMYDKAPGWAKKGCMSPDELARKVKEDGDDHDDGPVGLIWVIVHIMCWAIVAWWYFDPNFPSDLRLKEKRNNPLMIEQFAKLSINPNEDLSKSLPYPSLRVDSHNLEEQLINLGIDSEKPSLAICPGAEYGPAKKWPPNYYAEVCNEYLSNSWNVLVFGSQNDQITGNTIQEAIDKEFSDHFFNLTGKTSLIDVIDLLSHCKKVVTNDSGLMHIAAAVGTPLVAVYGPSSPQFTPPLIHNHVVLRKSEGFDKKREGSEGHGYHESLIAIKPNEVLEGLSRLNK